MLALSSRNAHARVSLVATGIIICLALSLSGCNGGAGSKQPVKGKVTFEGEPLVGGGTIRFVPLNGDGIRPSGGSIDKEGNYELTEPLPPGDYRVEIYQNDVLKDAEYSEVPEDSEEEPELISPEEPVPEDKRIPSYYNGTKSPLKVTVKAEENTIDLALKRNP